MSISHETKLTVFYCHNCFKEDNRSLEARLGSEVTLYPIACSGRLEPLFILRAMEQGSDAVCLLACDEGMCRYFEGNRRASKRVAFARTILDEIGIGGDRAFVRFLTDSEKAKPVKIITEALADAEKLGPSPLKGVTVKRRKK